jgi:hypothetical protein
LKPKGDLLAMQGKIFEGGNGGRSDGEGKSVQFGRAVDYLAGMPIY